MRKTLLYIRPAMLWSKSKGNLILNNWVESEVAQGLTAIPNQ